MNFMNIFAYIELATGVVMAASGIMALANSGQPWTGEALRTIINPALSGLGHVLPKVQIPPALLISLTDSAAALVNQFYHQSPKGGPPLT